MAGYFPGYTHRDNSKIWWYWKIPDLWKYLFFLHITMSMASAWLGGIGKYPPHPSRLRQYLLLRRLRLRRSEVLPQPLRILRVFSNTSSPCWCHYYNVSGLCEVKLILLLSRWPYIAEYLDSWNTIIYFIIITMELTVPCMYDVFPFILDYTTDKL